MTTPCFSVVVPCYMYGHYLHDCIDSIVSQAGVTVEVLIVDDCSPDDSADVAESIAREHPQVSVLRHATNLGHIRTFNDGLEWATNDYVIVLSADDLLAPGCLERAGRVFQEYPDVGLVYGEVAIFTGGAAPVVPSGRRASRTRVLDGWTWIEERCATAQNAAYSPEVIVRRTVQDKAGFYDPMCIFTSDLNMWLRVASHASVARIDGAVQACYRIHGSNMSRTVHASRPYQIQERLVAFDAFFASVEPSPQVSRLQRMANRASAELALVEALRLSSSSDQYASPEILELIEVAETSYSESRDLLHFKELRLRQRLGVHRVRWIPPQSLRDLSARAYSRLRRESKRRFSGVF